MTKKFDLHQFATFGLTTGCPFDQMENFTRAGIILQPTQLTASATARLCDKPDGPRAIGYGGARGGGKTCWLLAQIGADALRYMVATEAQRIYVRKLTGW